MMKRITLLSSLIAVVLVTLLGLQGCTPTKGGFKDGVYDEKVKSTSPGYEQAIVTVKDGKIASIDLKRLDDNQVEVNYDEWDGTNNGFPNLKQYRVDLANAMIAKQSADVDTIAGATGSSNGWKAAVNAAIEKAKK